METKTYNERVEEVVVGYRSLLGNLLDQTSFGEYVSSFHHAKVEDYLRTTLTRFAEVVREEVISYIGQKEGWEESEDVYREHFCLPTKYKK